MKRDGLARVSKIDLDALLDKNKSLAEGVILFPRSTSALSREMFANSGFFEVKRKLRDYSKSEWEKFLYLDDPKVKVKSLGHARGIASKEFGNGSPRRGRPLVSIDSALSIRK